MLLLVCVYITSRVPLPDLSHRCSQFKLIETFRSSTIQWVKKHVSANVWLCAHTCKDNSQLNSIRWNKRSVLPSLSPEFIRELLLHLCICIQYKAINWWLAQFSDSLWGQVCWYMDTAKSILNISLRSYTLWCSCRRTCICKCRWYQ